MGRQKKQLDDHKSDEELRREKGKKKAPHKEYFEKVREKWKDDPFREPVAKKKKRRPRIPPRLDPSDDSDLNPPKGKGAARYREIQDDDSDAFPKGLLPSKKKKPVVEK